MNYGYCRISTGRQNIERQVRNIIAKYPETKIYKEVFTGRKKQGRKELEKILKRVQSGDTIIFDSVSRMSRNADEGTSLYFELYDKGVDLVFLNEPYVNTQVYKQDVDSKHIQLIGDETDILIHGIENYLKALAQKQIRIAFEQSQKEVDDLSQRTAEGIKTAQLNGKTVGHPRGKKLNVKKAAPAKKLIFENSKDFCGKLRDVDCIRLCGIAKNTFYKYKKELRAEQSDSK